MIPPIRGRAAATRDGIIGPVVIEVADDGTIASIEPTTAAGPDVLLAPGFVDLQVNGIDEVDVATAAGDDWLRLASSLLDQGVTAWCPTLVTAPLASYALPLERIATAARLAADPGSGSPVVLGAHLEGPFLGRAPGAHRPELIVPVDLEWIEALPSIVRLLTLAAEQPLAPQAVRRLGLRGVAVSIGHSAPSRAQFEASVDAGSVMVTHLYNGMSGLHHRSPGLAAFALTDARVATGLIADLVHVEASMIGLAFAAQPPGSVALVTDAVAWRAGTAGNVRLELRDGAPRLADGTLAGSCLTMDAAIRNVVHRAGVPLAAALTAAATTPARLVGAAAHGRLAVGARADVVALDDDLHLRAVHVGGVRVR